LETGCGGVLMSDCDYQEALAVQIFKFSPRQSNIKPGTGYTVR
jgi:hypothetical protein